MGAGIGEGRGGRQEKNRADTRNNNQTRNFCVRVCFYCLLSLGDSVEHKRHLQGLAYVRYSAGWPNTRSGGRGRLPHQGLAHIKYLGGQLQELGPLRGPHGPLLGPGTARPLRPFQRPFIRGRGTGAASWVVTPGLRP